MTVSEAPDSERAIRHTRLEPSSSLPHPKLPPRSQHADNRTQCEVYRERDPETDSGYEFELGSRRLLINAQKWAISGHFAKMLRVPFLIWYCDANIGVMEPSNAPNLPFASFRSAGFI